MELNISTKELNVIADRIADRILSTPVGLSDMETPETLAAAPPETKTVTAEPKQAAEETMAAEPTMSLEEVRAEVAKIGQKGKSEEIKKLLKDLGATKLSTLDSGKYQELLKKARAL